MPDRMSNIVLFETEEEVKAYKSVLEKCYGMNVEVYVRCLQEKFPKLEECSIESQSRVIVIKALTTAWLVTGMQRTIDQKNLSQCDAERMIMSNTLACVALSIKYLCAPQIEFAQLIQEILKKDFGGVSKNESVEEYIKNYNENREQLIGSMDKDASFCPPILYAPSTDEINGFALSTTKKLVERIGIYFPEKVEKQKSKKTERTKDKSGVVEFAAKMERWRSTGESYKSKLSTRLNELYRKIIENAYNAKKQRVEGSSVSEKVVAYYAEESIFRYDTILNVAENLNNALLNKDVSYQKLEEQIQKTIRRPITFYIREFDRAELLDSEDTVSQFCDYMRTVMILIIEGISWLETYDSRIECATKLICDYIDRNFERLFGKAYDSLEGKGSQDNKAHKIKKCPPNRVYILNFIIELYSVNNRYYKNGWANSYGWFIKQIGLDLGYKNSELEIEDESMMFSERMYGMRYDPEKRKIKRWNPKSEEGEWQDISAEVINQLATEIYKECYYGMYGSDNDKEFMCRKIWRKNVKNNICGDLKFLGIDLAPEELEKLNDESDYPEGYIEGVLWAQKQIDEGGVFYSVFG